MLFVWRVYQNRCRRSKKTRSRSTKSPGNEYGMYSLLWFDIHFMNAHRTHTHTNTLILLFNRFNHKICNSWNQFNKPESRISFVYWNSLCHTDLFFLSFKLNWIKHRTCERFIVLLILFRLFWMKCHFLQHVLKFVDGNIHAYICVYEFFFSHTYYPLCSLIFTESLEWYNHIPVRLFFVSWRALLMIGHLCMYLH